MSLISETARVVIFLLIFLSNKQQLLPHQERECMYKQKTIAPVSNVSVRHVLRAYRVSKRRNSALESPPLVDPWLAKHISQFRERRGIMKNIFQDF